MKFFCKYLKIERNTNLTEYIKIHQPENMWPEIVKGMEDVGILGMELYHVENMIIMTMRTTDSFCADRDLSLLASKPRQSEWEAYVSSFQGVDADASAKAKWTEIPEIYSMEKCQKYLEKQKQNINNKLKVIDSHHHLWEFNQSEFPWIDNEMSVLKNNFYPNDLKNVTQEHNVVGSVVVQARQSLDETLWLINQAEQDELIKGVVGWIDLKSPQLEKQLQFFKKFKVLKGFRHVIHDEPDIDFMIDQKFVDGIKLLAKYDYTYDILIKSYHLENTIKLLHKLPPMKLVINHIAKPNMLENEWESWANHISYISKNFPHVFCKLSGLATEENHQNVDWANIERYSNFILETFTPSKVMFGSDWPVCMLATTYDEHIYFIQKICDSFIQTDIENIFFNVSKDFYGIEI
ncbi:hypothetical protein CF386_06450 [Paraphotobacterium marinum]|uniref:Amidohydrolase-related domain-containing protein n=1 Tax=Paraphotobacterium marinum TaxID=1755811 RepID=A0A220VEM1_9GAMM|nr:amidohydrolase family protein [Paraphotobacterium marinum]ASK78666.1 hypothetical protein CF386_06450 [Paraphotobacterium marinum]